MNERDGVHGARTNEYEYEFRRVKCLCENLTSKIVAEFCLPISQHKRTHKHHVSQFSGDERVSN